MTTETVFLMRFLSPASRSEAAAGRPRRPRLLTPSAAAAAATANQRAAAPSARPVRSSGSGATANAPAAVSGSTAAPAGCARTVQRQRRLVRCFVSTLKKRLTVFISLICFPGILQTQDFRNQINNNSFQESLVFQIPHGHKPGTFPTSLTHKYTVLSPIIDTSVNWRTGSFHGYWGRRSCRRDKSSLAAGDQGLPCDVQHPLTPLDHRLSVYDNVPNDHQLSGSEGGSGESIGDVEQMGEESDLSRLLKGQDVFSALDSILERISDLQQLVSSWSESLSEDNCQRGSSSLSSSSSQDSPGHSSSGASPCPSSPSHIHLEVQRSEEEVEQSTKKVTRSQRSR